MLKRRTSFTKKEEVSKYKEILSKTITTEQLALLTDHQYAHSSLLAMAKDWNLFSEFCRQHQLCVLPASSTTVRRFIEYESRKRKFSTIRRYTVTITVIHKFMSCPDPIRQTDVRLLLMSLRQEKKGDNKQADAFDLTHLQILNKRMQHSKSKRDIRDLAIYFLMFECALKRAELRDFQTSQLLDHDIQHLHVTLHQETYGLSAEATLAIGKWRSLIDTGESPYLFRSIDRHQNIAANKLNDSSIYRILRNAGERLGMKHLKFSGQSTRIGAARELHKQGMKVKEIQSFGRWHSPVMPAQYVGNTHSAETMMLHYKSFKPWK
ncbi:Tyrosine recombinase XerC [Vibrio aerogenes CECT 7868]|uniref:Tyrosine recombinase XerC n=1 Tax=Vibrio aerogenes CECT 7868 TaxID=1216006 RepID=A0A1M5ZNM4_9VIBR|nr:tyrosine-type recombinase/integrase [Vibrio aerogenes]SHI25995.1 Tyrosine recombinase XerC [Vibrio aerogenes CECT 7868]